MLYKSHKRTTRKQIGGANPYNMNSLNFGFTPPDPNNPGNVSPYPKPDEILPVNIQQTEPDIPSTINYPPNHYTEYGGYPAPLKQDNDDDDSVDLNITKGMPDIANRGLSTFVPSQYLGVAGSNQTVQTAIVDNIDTINKSINAYGQAIQPISNALNVVTKPVQLIEKASDTVLTPIVLTTGKLAGDTLKLFDKTSNETGKLIVQGLLNKDNLGDRTPEQIEKASEVISPILVKAGETALTIAVPELAPVIALKDSVVNNDSSVDTIIAVGESLASVKGALGNYVRAGTAGILAGNVLKDIKNDKSTAVILANLGTSIGQEIPGDSELAQSVRSLAQTVKLLAPLTFDKPKKESTEESIEEPEKEQPIKEEPKIDQTIIDQTIIDKIKANSPNKIYTDNGLAVINEFVNRTNYKVDSKLQKQLDDYNNRQVEVADTPTEVNVPDIKEVEQASVSKINKYIYEVQDKPIILNYPDYTGQVKIYKSYDVESPISIDCSKLKGRQKLKCEKQKLKSK